jgi:hypothetical protein
MHLCVRIAPLRIRRRPACRAGARARGRAPRPGLATSAWWKEEREGVFIDYNQNAKDRTTASAYSVRPTPDARVSTPLSWDEVPDCDPAAFTLATVPARFARSATPGRHRRRRGDARLAAGTRGPPGRGRARRRAVAAALREGEDEPRRVAPSRRAGARSRTAKSSAAAKSTTSGAAATSATSAEKTAPRAKPTRAAAKAALVTIACAKRREDALAGLERWKARHPAVAERLGPSDVLVDTMRGRSSTWTRVRINLRAVPVADRPPAEPPDPDYDPRSEWRRS